MTNGIVQETSKIAQQTVSALNSVPVLLALVLLQFFILGAVMYLNVQREGNVNERFMKLIDGCLAIQKDSKQRSNE
jgi:cytochrome bd-type quinol oxidase subunit 2